MLIDPNLSITEWLTKKGFRFDSNHLEWHYGDPLRHQPGSMALTDEIVQAAVMDPQVRAFLVRRVNEALA